MKSKFFSALIVAIGCTLSTAGNPNALAAAQTDDAEPVRVPATVRGFQSADLFAKVGGYIREMKVDIGDRVTQGQPLCILDVPEMEKQVQQKQSLLRQAEAETRQADARIEETEAQLQGYEAAVREAQMMTIQKKAFLKFQVAENDRISKLAQRGAVQKELIDSATYQLDAAKADVQATEAKIATAEANLAGARAAVERSRADQFAAQSNVDVAKSNLEYIKQMLEYTTIRAPFDGIVTSRMFDAGAFVQSAEGNSGAKPVLHIVRMDKVRVSFSLSMSSIKGLKKGDRVVFGEIDALPDQTFDGTVSRHAPVMDEATRMMRVEVDLENPDGKLLPGFFGYATLFVNPDSK